MSSPIAKINKGFLNNVLIAIHRKYSHSTRVEILSTAFADIIQRTFGEDRKICLLDVGCGDMAIAKALASRRNNLTFTCIDIYPNHNNWENYFKFDGKNIPFDNKTYDVVLLSDVLHHCHVDLKALLREAKRVSEIILIKDHFEYGFWSRIILRLADFIGNYGYGVNIPDHYFSKQSYSDLLKDLGFQEIERLCPVQIYRNLFLGRILFKSKYQFISTIH